MTIIAVIRDGKYADGVSQGAGGWWRAPIDERVAGNARTGAVRKVSP